jgi:DNA-directed RNA polymerase subunit beta
MANNIGPTLEKDKTKTRIEALHAIYKILRPGDLATDERVEELFKNTFLDEKRFDLGEIARMKIEKKLKIKTKYTDENGKFLSIEEIVKSLKYFMNLRA